MSSLIDKFRRRTQAKAQAEADAAAKARVLELITELRGLQLRHPELTQDEECRTALWQVVKDGIPDGPLKSLMG